MSSVSSISKKYTIYDITGALSAARGCLFLQIRWRNLAYVAEFAVKA